MYHICKIKQIKSCIRYHPLLAQINVHEEDKTAHQVKYSRLSKISHIISIVKEGLETIHIRLYSSLSRLLSSSCCFSRNSFFGFIRLS